MITLPIYIFILIELLAVSILDLKFRKIRNIWVILNLFISSILFMIMPDLYLLELNSFQYSIVFILVGFILYLLKIMGGGDSKFLATIFLLIPASLQDRVFLWLLIITIIIGSLVFLNNIFQNFSGIIESFKHHNVQAVKNYFGKKFPYAPVILITWIWIGWELRHQLI